jgi:hypothetical protein
MDEDYPEDQAREDLEVMRELKDEIEMLNGEIERYLDGEVDHDHLMELTEGTNQLRKI